MNQRFKDLELIAFDADDTLWHNETLYTMTQQRFKELLAPYHDGEIVDRLGFEILYQPDRPDNPEAFKALFGGDREGFLADYPYDVRATTDDKPFFFFFLNTFSQSFIIASGIEAMVINSVIFNIGYIYAI